jgi:hypothetical protein
MSHASTRLPSSEVPTTKFAATATAELKFRLVSSPILSVLLLATLLCGCAPKLHPAIEPLRHCHPAYRQTFERAAMLWYNTYIFEGYPDSVALSMTHQRIGNFQSRLPELWYDAKIKDWRYQKPTPQ